MDNTLYTPVIHEVFIKSGENNKQNTKQILKNTPLPTSMDTTSAVAPAQPQTVTRWITASPSPLSYCDEKALPFEDLQTIAGVFTDTDNTYPHYEFIGWRLHDVDGNDCGYERIYSRDCIDREGRRYGKNNKRVAAKSKPSEGFKLLGADSLDNINHAYIVAGLADGISVHLATQSPVVMVVGEGNAPKIARAIIAKHPELQLTAALDNDPAGRAACHRTRLNWVVPANHNDWSDVRQADGVEAVAEQLAAINAPLPVFDAQDLKQAELDASYDKCLVALGKAANAQEAANIAFSIAMRFVMRTPVFMDAQQIAKDLITHSTLLHVDTVSDIKDRMDWINDNRRTAALSSVSIHPALKARHNYIPINSVDEIDINKLDGHTLLKAPMASGKTQAILAPLATACREIKAPMLAVCHRQTLAREMTNRLGTDHYQDIPLELSGITNSVTTCIDSLIKPKLLSMAGRAEVLMVDEASQVLRSIYGKHTQMQESKHVGNKLREVVERAELGIYADADINSATVRYIESCRPEGERLTIYEVAPPKDNGKTVNIITGKNPKVPLIARIVAAIRAGERVIVATDSLPATKLIAEAVRQEVDDVKSFVINSDTSGNKEQQKFLEDADKESELYQMVVHSPSISSGVSIQTTQFDHGFGYFCGVITPSDAIQMLARARMLRYWDVAIQPNNSNRSKIQSERLLLTAAEEVTGLTTGDYDRLVAQHEADDNTAKADFAAGMFWQLEHAGFTVTTERNDQQDTGILKELRGVIDEEHTRAILSAQDITEEENETLRREFIRTEQQVYACLKFQIKRDLCLSKLTKADIDVWDNGYGMSRIRRFALAFLHDGEADHEDVSPIMRRNEAEIARHQREILRLLGMDFNSQDETPKCHTSAYSSKRIPPKCDSLAISGESVKPAIEYIEKFAISLSYLGVVPGSTVSERKPTKKNPVGGFVFKRPKHSVKFVNQVLDKMGVSMKLGKQKRDSEGANPNNKDNRVRPYSPDPIKLEAIAEYAGRMVDARNRPVAEPPQPQPEQVEPFQYRPVEPAPDQYPAGYEFMAQLETAPTKPERKLTREQRAAIEKKREAYNRSPKRVSA